MKQGYDQPVLWRQLGDKFGHQFFGKMEIVIGGSVHLGGSELLDSGGYFFAEIAEPPFRANLFRLQCVETGVDRYAGNPMLERHAATVLIEFVKDFDENHLNQVFLADPP